MAISPSGFAEHQKGLLDKTVDNIVEKLDAKIIERATYQLLDVLRITYFDTEEPLHKVCEEVCYRYLKNGWAEVGYKIEKAQAETYKYTVNYVFLTNDNRKSWYEKPESNDYIVVTKIKER